MPYVSRRCGCNICRFQNDPISGRTVRFHESRYGVYTCASPLSSPWKDQTNDSSNDANNDERAHGYFISTTTDSESEHEVQYADQSLENQDGRNLDEKVSESSNSNYESFESADDEDLQCEYNNESTDNGNQGDESEDMNSDSGSSIEGSTSNDDDDDIDNNIPWSVKYNKEIYYTGIAVQKLPNSDFTLLQWLAMNFMLFSSHPSFSKQTFTENLRMQKILQSASSDLLPSTYYEARKLIQPYLVKKLKYDVCINDCVIYRDSNKSKFAELQQCPLCKQDRYILKKGGKSISHRTFGYIPIGPRLARIYGETNLAKLVQSHPGDTYNGTEMYDIHHSPAWKSLYSQSEGSYFKGDKMGISFALELDGVNPYHNIGVLYSMTPIMLTILNLPRHVRNTFSNINLIGIIHGRRNHGSADIGTSTHISQDAYLELLVDELLHLTECKAYSEYHKGPVDVKIKLLLYVLDYPGLSKLFNQHGSGSLAGCHWCHIQGVRCKHLDKVLYLSNSSYLKSGDQMKKDQTARPKLRSMSDEKRYREAYTNAKNKTQASFIATATGCKNIYPLASLPGHNRIEESKPDACHTIKDVTQTIMNLLTNRNVNLAKVVLKEEAERRFHVINPSSRTASSCRQIPSKKHKSNSSEKVYPFMLTKEELALADRRAASIRPPSGFGLKPSPFFSKPGSLKSHDYKQIASQGIIQFCLRDALSDRCRQTLFYFFDCISALCKESQDQDNVEEMEENLNKALASLEHNFPLSLQNITTHLLHHIPESIKLYGPVYSTWMYVFERFNSWICSRSLNMRYPEATATETFLIYEWCHFMVATGRIPDSSSTGFSDVSAYDDYHEVLDEIKDKQLSSVGKRNMPRPKPRDLNHIHKLCNDGPGVVCSREDCFLTKYFVHHEQHSATKRTVTYTCRLKESKSAKTVSSYVCSEFDRGKQQNKVITGKFILFGQIQYFVRHKNCKTGSITEVAYVKWFKDLIFDSSTHLWKGNTNGDHSSSYFCTKDLSMPLVTAEEDSWVWFLNSGKLHVSSLSANTYTNLL